MTKWGQEKKEIENCWGFCVQRGKKNYLIFKTQHYIMIYFSMCGKKKSPMGELLAFKGSLLNQQIPCSLNVCCLRKRRQKAFGEKNVTGGWDKGSINSLIPKDMILAQPLGFQSIPVRCSFAGFNCPQIFIFFALQEQPIQFHQLEYISRQKHLFL